MIMPFEYLAFIIGWVILVFGYYIKDWAIKGIISIFFMILGVYVLINGIESVSNLAVDAMGIIHIVIGFYIMVTEAYELYKNM